MCEMVKCEVWKSAVTLLFIAALGLLWIAAQTGELHAESVELDTSQREIPIESDFDGADVIIFGAVDDSKQPEAGSGYYDLIVVIRGPAETVITRRKENSFGLWVNGESRSFTDVPSYYAVLSTRPLNQIASAAVLQRLYIELDPTPFEKEPEIADEFEEALIRLKTEQGFYVKDPVGVRFLSKSLFRASLALPTGVSEGEYSVRIYLFHDQELLSWDKSVLTVRKAGFERILYTMAFSQPYTYGILAVIVAIFSGLAGWTIFSRN